MARAAKLIVQMPIDGAVDRRLRADPPASVARGEVALDAAPATDDGRLEPPDVGVVVASYPSPESLRRDRRTSGARSARPATASSRWSSSSRRPTTCATRSSSRCSGPRARPTVA